jgi:acetyltransferase-like isoleucine patch superfamily enzyme
MKRASIDGQLSERLRLQARAHRAGATVRWPYRLPHGKGRKVSRQIDLGQGTYLGKNAWININSTDARLRIGAGTVIGNDFMITCGSLVEVAEGVLMSDRVALLDQLHDYDSWLAPQLTGGSTEPPHFSWAMTEPRPVRIGSGTWIGIGVVVLPGVTIGEGCVVGANSVVTKDLPDYSIAAGAPARVLRNLKDGASGSLAATLNAGP